jgi:hypothetical protein
MAEGNGDQPDVPETGRWWCSECQEGGSCVAGDELMALYLHRLAVHLDLFE